MVKEIAFRFTGLDIAVMHEDMFSKERKEVDLSSTWVNLKKEARTIERHAKELKIDMRIPDIFLRLFVALKVFQNAPRKCHQELTGVLYKLEQENPMYTTE